MDAPTQQTYLIEGMTCEHCVAAVRGELSGVPGVMDVQVELAGGRAVVSGSGVAEDAVRAAVEEAGYTLAAS
jgi:copper chaperone CopZ